MRTLGQLIHKKLINTAEAKIAHQYRFEPALWSHQANNLPSTHTDRVAKRSAVREGDRKFLVVG